jgi:hypothetical protein
MKDGLQAKGVPVRLLLTQETKPLGVCLLGECRVVTRRMK